MGLNGILRVMTEWTMTNSANNKILRVRFGGIGGTSYLSTTRTADSCFADIKKIANRGAANSQFGINTAGYFGSGGTSGATSAIDTSAATTLVITGQKASAGETITLESYLVELILP